MSTDVVLPFPGSANIGYFLVHAPDLRSLAVSINRSVWILPTPAAQMINELLTKVDQVALFFCVDELLGFYGICCNIIMNAMCFIITHFLSQELPW
jgi:hypothetical protein